MTAAYAGAFSLTADFTEAEFDHTMAVDLKGVWLGMKYEIKQMLSQTPAGGAIVNTSSINGLGGAPQASLYSAAKAGILGLSQSAAMEYGTKGMRINVLAAGAFDTPMLKRSFDLSSDGDAETRTKIVDGFKAMVAAGRIGNPEEGGRSDCLDVFGCGVVCYGALDDRGSRIDGAVSLNYKTLKALTAPFKRCPPESRFLPWCSLRY